MADLVALPYYGGKVHAARWIADNLPWRRRSTYCEPFGGMASVLLRRAPVSVEILNDQSERVINWWRAVRDHRQEFGALVEGTPYSRAEFDWARAAMDDPSVPSIRRALAFHICVGFSVLCSDKEGRSHFGLAVTPDVGSRGRWRSERVARLAARLWDVQLERMDAVELLDRIAGESGAVIYADPPYRSADTSPYSHAPDWEALTDAFHRQTGAVAVSGYGDEWNHLGWHRMERAASSGIARSRQSDPARTEVLWTNYDPADLSRQRGHLPFNR